MAAAQIGTTKNLGSGLQTQTAQACLDNDVNGTVTKAADKLAEVDVAHCL